VDPGTLRGQNPPFPSHGPSRDICSRLAGYPAETTC
jgi:hypothetical protein